MNTNGHNMTKMDRNIRKKKYTEKQKNLPVLSSKWVSFSEQHDPDGATICGGSLFDVQKYDKNDRYGQE
jgi:hypothetical protein